MNLILYVCILMIYLSFLEVIEKITNKNVLTNLDPSPPLQGGYKGAILKGSFSTGTRWNGIPWFLDYWYRH